ncbi:MAG: PspC domain-containing protein [Faecousia sp.]
MQKKLYRAEEGKLLFGVCAGIAEYFDIDPTLVRLACALLCCMSGIGIVAYIIAACILPTKSSVI